MNAVSAQEQVSKADVNALGDKILAQMKHGYGYPFTAATAAAMNDTAKIYVYTGSEAGYTNGNWYYHNGTAWVSGGVYNATALETDKTLTISGAAADAKVTGNKFQDITSKVDTDENVYNTEITAISGTEHIPSQMWEIGGITWDGSSPNFASNPRRARTKQTSTLRLYKGDVIGLSDYTNNKYALYGKREDNSWFFSGDNFLFKDYTLTEDLANCLLVVIKSGTETNISEPYSYGSLVKINRVALKNKYVLTSDVKGNIIKGVNGNPLLITDAALGKK